MDPTAHGLAVPRAKDTVKPIRVPIEPIPAEHHCRWPLARALTGGNIPVAARVHIGKDGTVTVLTGKVEAGQGARAELTQAAAEELRLPPDRIHLVMADTGLVPDDGVTAGSRTTPSSVPAVRQGAAAARELLAQLAARRWDPGVPLILDALQQCARSGTAAAVGAPVAAKTGTAPCVHSCVVFVTPSNANREG